MPGEAANGFRWPIFRRRLLKKEDLMMCDAPTPLSFFRQLSGIPRISGHEQAAADFVQRIA